MGRITRSSTDQEKPQRKRRKKDLDRIHSKILQAKRKLDKIGKGDNKEQKKQGRAKICNRLLPEPAAGIYRNGAKGKDIQKAETLENTYHKARLKADALKLLNGDTHKSERIVEIPIQNKSIKQSVNKDCIQNNFESNELCTQELSPVLGNRQSQNQKPCLAKKKGEENIFEDTNFNKTKKQNITDKSRQINVQKEDICKRRLFQNDKEPSETIITNSTEIFDDTDLTKENKTSDKETELIGSKNKDLLCDPLSRYMEFCKVSAKNFETDILQNYSSDPVTSTIKKLKHAYADSFRQQLLRKKKKQELENTNPTHSVEHQACVSSDTSPLSPVEFEVPKCSKNYAIAAHFQEGVSHKDNKFHLVQNTKLKKRDGTMGYNFTSCLLRNTVTSNSNINNLVENCENGDNKYSKQSKDICQLAKSTNLFVVNEKDSVQMDSQKNPNYVNHLLKNKRHDKVNFSFDISDHKNLHVDNNSKFLEKSIFLSDPVLSERHFSNDYCREKLPITVSDNCALNNISKKYNNKITNNCEVKNVKRVPAILRRCVDIPINKPNHSVQINGDVEGLHKKCETNLFNGSNGTKKELCETIFPNSYTSFPTPSIVNAIVDQTKILEPQIGSMKIKDSQESQIEQINANMHSKEYNERNEFHRYRNFLYPRPFEVSCNTNTEKLLQQEQISPDIRKSFYRSNYHPINHLQSVSLSNSNVESKKQFSQQTKLHMCEANKQELYRKNIRDQNQNILFNNVNDRAIPPILNITQAEKRSAESCQENRFGKTDVKCTKNQINENACHCNEQYIYFDSANCPRKYKEQAYRCHKETAQPESLCDTTRGYNNSVDNCINLSNSTQNVPLLTLRQNDGLYMYPKAIDNQHRAVLLQNVTQPVKYLAVENGSNIQKIPVYINDRSVRVAENAPLKVIAVMDSSIQTKTFPQEIATKVVSLQTDNSHFNNFATRKISDQSYVKHLDSVNAILLNSDSQSNMWYAPNL